MFRSSLCLLASYRGLCFSLGQPCLKIPEALEEGPTIAEWDPSVDALLSERFCTLVGVCSKLSQLRVRHLLRPHRSSRNSRRCFDDSSAGPLLSVLPLEIVVAGQLPGLNGTSCAAYPACVAAGGSV